MNSITRFRQNEHGASTPFDSYTDVLRVGSDEVEAMSREQLLHLCLEQHSLLLLLISIVYSRMTDISTRLVALDLVLQAVQKNVRKSIGSITESMPVLIGGSPRTNKSCKPCRVCATDQEYERETATHFVYSCQCGKTKTTTQKGIADRLGMVRNTVSSACDAMVASGALVREYRPGVKGQKQHLDVAFQPAFLEDPTIIQNKTIRKERTPSTKKGESCPKCGSEDVDVMKAHACHTCQQITQTVVRKAPLHDDTDAQQMQMNEYEVEATVQTPRADAQRPMTSARVTQQSVLVMDSPSRSNTRTEQLPPAFPLADVLRENTTDRAAQQRSDVTEEYMDDAPPPTPHQTLLLHAPLEEPNMIGRWSNEKCVQYEEWKNKKRCRETMRPQQLAAASWLHKQDPDLTLEQFKKAYDEIFPWWRENNGPLHVSDMKVKQKNNIVRLYAMLDRIEAREKKVQHPTPVKSVRGSIAPSSAETSELAHADELVLWSPLSEAILDPLEYFESFRYMSVAEAETYGYAFFKKLVPMDENNVLGKQRGLAATHRAERESENESR